MGCWPSRIRKPDPNPTPLPSVARSASSRRHSSVLLPPEEETVVKEVLSETPLPLPLPPPPRFPTRIREDLKPVPSIAKKPPPLAPAPVPEPADVSEASEISVSTVEEYCSGEVRRRSPAKPRARAYSGETRNPGRVPSPGRVGRNPGVAARRRDSGETSGRRSNSPAARSGLGRNPSGKKTGRVGSDNATRKVEESKNVAPTVGDESLENPLVSLECFIFL